MIGNFDPLMFFEIFVIVKIVLEVNSNPWNRQGVGGQTLKI